MKTLARNLALTLVALCLIPIASPQAAPKAAPKPADSPSKTLLDNWNEVGRKLIAMAEDFPEDKYDFKPNPVQRSFAEQLLHAAGGNYYFIDPAKGIEAPKGDPKRADYATKLAVVAFVKKSFADGAWGFIEHSGEHYGQLVVYYRVAGLVPPESRPKK